MKYAFRYCRGSWGNYRGDEVIIKYTERSGELIDFCKEAKNRVILDITEWEDFENTIEDCFSIFKLAMEECPELTIMTTSDDDYEGYKAEGFKFFFKDGAGTWDQLHAFIKAGVSDIRVINELCFSMVDVANICHDNGVQVRCYPNVAQSSASTVGTLNTARFFFIRPEDLFLYKDLIDVVEFYGSVDKQDTLYRVYKSEYWPDELNILILGLKEDIYGDTIIPHFGVTRLNCKKKCSYRSCGICDRCINLSHTFDEKGYVIEKEKPKKIYTEEVIAKIEEDYKTAVELNATFEN